MSANTVQYKQTLFNKINKATGTQGTNISTTVVMNAECGAITTQAADAAAAAENAFAVTNSKVLATDMILLSPVYAGTAGTPITSVSDIAAGTFTVTITNVHASDALNGAFVINFLLIHTV